MAPKFITDCPVFGRAALLVCVFTSTAGMLPGQELLPGSNGVVRPLYSDVAVLESPDVRQDLPCRVESVKPVLGFDLKFHAGYEVRLPLKEIAGEGDLLTVVFRITRSDRPAEPVYLSDRVDVPSIESDAKGDAYLNGMFDLGEGRYHVAWLMRDRSGRVCSNNWEVEAALPSRDREMTLNVAPGAVLASEQEPFKKDPPVARAQSGPLNVKVLVNFAPQDPASAALRYIDTSALVSILRNIDRDPRIGKFSLVAFNMGEQRVLYRQEDAAQIDFPALGDAIKSLKLGTVDLKLLGQKHPGADFLSDLIARELGGDPERPDAVIIAGPKVEVDGPVSEEALRRLGDVKLPVFYMNYNLNPQANPWRDAIGSVVRSLKGAEFTISRPRDLFFAWSDIMGRVVRSKFGGTVAGNSSSQ